MTEYVAGGFAPSHDHNESNARLIELANGYFAFHSSTPFVHHVTLVAPGDGDEYEYFRRVGATHAFLSEKEALSFVETSAKALPAADVYILFGEILDVPVIMPAAKIVRRGKDLRPDLN